MFQVEGIVDMTAMELAAVISDHGVQFKQVVPPKDGIDGKIIFSDDVSVIIPFDFMAPSVVCKTSEHRRICGMGRFTLEGLLSDIVSALNCDKEVRSFH